MCYIKLLLYINISDIKFYENLIILLFIFIYKNLIYISFSIVIFILIAKTCCIIKVVYFGTWYNI